MTALSPEEFKRCYRSKGWSGKDLAAHWGISVTWISKLGNDINRPVYWDDAVKGLPNHKLLEQSMNNKVTAVQVTYKVPGDPGEPVMKVKFSVPLEKTEHEILTAILGHILQSGPVLLERIEFISDLAPWAGISESLDITSSSGMANER